MRIVRLRLLYKYNIIHNLTILFVINNFTVKRGGNYPFSDELIIYWSLAKKIVAMGQQFVAMSLYSS
jgi:hypothetical protein